MKTNYRKLKDNIDHCLSSLLNKGQIVSPGEWQSTKIGVDMIEITDVIFQSPIPLTVEKLITECDPHIPWAEDHFQERVGGLPLNPGVQYQHWPFYQPGSFKEAPGEKFSHTYMERFWPKFANLGILPSNPPSEWDKDQLGGRWGIRYQYGDYMDVVKRLKSNPETRQAFLSIWHPEDQSLSAVRIPCTIGYHFMIREGRLNITYMIRSCDAIRHFKNDIYMAARLAQHTVKLLDMPDVYVGDLLVWIGSFHCFQSDSYTLKKQIK